MGLAVDRRHQLGLDLRHARLMVAGQVAEEALAREPPQLDRGTFHLLRRVQPGQLVVALVDLLDVERVLQTCEMQVVLLVDVGDESVGPVPECFDLARLWSHRSLGYGPVHRLTIETGRHTQLLDITEQVREAIQGASGAAVLVYVPHTTAGLTINEHADPMVARDFEMALERIAPESGAGSTSRRARRTRRPTSVPR